MINPQTKHLLWDWNGTLLDDALITYQTILEIFDEPDRPAISFEDYRRTFKIPVIDFYREVGVDIDRITMLEISKRFHHVYEAKRPEFKLHQGVTDALLSVAKLGIPQSIFSAHPQVQIEEALDILKIRAHFHGVLGATSNQGVSKEKHGRDWFESSKLQAAEVTLIGDTDHDADVARSLGFNCILIANGHQNEQVLGRTGFPVVRTVEEFRVAIANG